MEQEGFYIIRHEYGEGKANRLFDEAENGNVSAQLELARCFEDSGNRVYAFRWLRKAAIQDSAEAMYKLSLYYSGKYQGIERNPKIANIFLKQAILRKYPKAFHRLGNLYYDSSDSDQIRKKAFRCYQIAAKLGDDESKEKIGLSYLNGDGVEKNETFAVEWFKKSGDAKWGYYYLAECYLNGTGVQKNEELATKYYELALYGGCFEKTETEKKLLFLYASGFGGEKADEKLKRIKASLDAQDEHIKQLAELWSKEETIQQGEEQKPAVEISSDTIKFTIIAIGNIALASLVNIFTYPFLGIAIAIVSSFLVIVITRTKISKRLIAHYLNKHGIGDSYDVPLIRRFWMSVVVLEMGVIVAAGVAVAFEFICVLLFVIVILTCSGYLIEGREREEDIDSVWRISKLLFKVGKVISFVSKPISNILEFLLNMIAKWELALFGIKNTFKEKEPEK